MVPFGMAITDTRIKAVVTAGAVVTKDVPPMTVVGGILAKVLKQIDPKERTEQDETVG